MITTLSLTTGSVGLFAFFAAPTKPLRTIGAITAVFSTVGFWASIIGV